MLTSVLGEQRSPALDGAGLRIGKTVNGTTTAQVRDEAEGIPLLVEEGWVKYVTGAGGLPAKQVTGSTALFACLGNRLEEWRACACPHYQVSPSSRARPSNSMAMNGEPVVRSHNGP